MMIDLKTSKSVSPSVNNDKIVQQLLKKLDEGSETILNLRSLLTLKTMELNELVHQLELIDQVLVNVENGTEQIELVLKDVISSTNQQAKLLNAEAALDSAIKSACSLYSIDHNSTHHLMSKIQTTLKELHISKTIHLYKNDDIKVLQKAYKDLDLAKTIVASVKTDFKQRSTLLKKKNPPLDKIKQIGSNIRKQTQEYRSLTRNAPLLLNGKEDIITILDREDHQLAAAKKVNKQSVARTSTIITTKKQQPQQPSVTITTAATTTTNNTHKSTLQMIARPTLTSMAKTKEKKPSGPGSTLRLRNMLAKRNPALKMMNEQMMMSSTVC